MNRFNRRKFLKASGAAYGAAFSCFGLCDGRSALKPIGRVIVIGGGFGGATAAKYLRIWSQGAIEVFLIERGNEFVSCPTSNLVLGGSKKIGDITRSYAKLRDYGVHVLRDEATGVNAEKKRVVLKKIQDLSYDRLIVSPGIELMHDQIQGYDAGAKRILHAWKAGRNGGATTALEPCPTRGLCPQVPRAPYRCPPGPYERACRSPPTSTGGPAQDPDPRRQRTSHQGALFKAAWKDLYGGIIGFAATASQVGGRARRTVRTDSTRSRAMSSTFSRRCARAISPAARVS
jgi:sulfite dehydrogenase